jgi:hypothetical protein
MNTAERDGTAELLPWYVNGTLAAPETTAVEDSIARSAGTRLELRLWQAVQTEVLREETTPATELGWRRVQKALRARKPTRSTRARTVAIAASVLALLGAHTVIVWQVAQERAGVMRPMSGSPDGVRAGEWRIQIRFRDDATAGQIRTLLDELSARIVEGPSALGVYEIAVPHSTRFADAAALAAWLSTQPIIEQSSAPP